jgi:parallel beta-helix repeat protein
VIASDITVTDCLFIGNVAGQSGAAHYTDGSGGTISGCTFAGNVGSWSACGGIDCVFSSNPTITNCTFVDNEDDHIWCDDSSPTIEYSILAFAKVGRAVVCDQGIENPHVHHCFVCANAAGDTLCGGNCHDIDYSDPLFCDRENGVLTLCENSPCLPGGTWPSLVGAHGQGCPPCESAVEPTTWGAIKALYK